MSIKTYKYTVIGNSLSAYLTFLVLSERGESCALFENADDLSCFGKKANTEADIFEFSNLYKFIDSGKESQRIYDWVCEEVLKNSFALKELDSSPKTYNDGKFSDFIGFGDFKARSLTELSSFNKIKFKSLNDQFIKKIEDKISQYQEHLYKGAIVTSFNFKKDDSAILSITINGNKEYLTERVIYCSSPKSLNKLMPTQLNDKLRQKIVKAKFYSQLVLDLKYTQAQESKPEHYFLYSRKEEFEPSLGLFENSSLGVVASQWASLIPEEATDDVEYVGKSLRNIKKQVKRAFPEGFKQLEKEKVTLEPSSFGYLELSAVDLKRIPQNLSISGPLLSPLSGVIADIDSAKKCLESL